jgi:hypothetical protein
MVIADNLKDYTFWISFPYYQGFGTITNLTLLFGYSIQIFADFAGYSLIAVLQPLWATKFQTASTFPTSLVPSPNSGECGTFLSQLA